MNLPQVVNVREVNLREPDVVRIDRLSAWGSPFLIGRDGTRAEVIEAYRGWICERPDLLDRLDELAGKRLACWCAPLACHGDVLVGLLAERGGVAAVASRCARCNSRYGTVPGLAVCVPCARDTGRTVPAADTSALGPVDPVAEGWAWMLAACSECGRNTIYEAGVCSHCRHTAALE